MTERNIDHEATLENVEEYISDVLRTSNKGVVDSLREGDRYVVRYKSTDREGIPSVYSSTFEKRIEKNIEFLGSWNCFGVIAFAMRKQNLPEDLVVYENEVEDWEQYIIDTLYPSLDRDAHWVNVHKQITESEYVVEIETFQYFTDEAIENIQEDDRINFDGIGSVEDNTMMYVSIDE